MPPKGWKKDLYDDKSYKRKSMKEIKLQFRALLPDGKYFEQKEQYLNSFLRRVQFFWNTGHDKYIEGGLESKLQILINDKWVQCKF